MHPEYVPGFLELLTVLPEVEYFAFLCLIVHLPQLWKWIRLAGYIGSERPCFCLSLICLLLSYAGIVDLKLSKTKLKVEDV